MAQPNQLLSSPDSSMYQTAPTSPDFAAPAVPVLSTVAPMAGTGSRAGGSVSTSFLFVVNEISVAQGTVLDEDEWGNPLPPKVKAGYGPETVGTVFRFRDGGIEVAPEYEWRRVGASQRGQIGRSINANTTFLPTPRYKVVSVFDCGSFLPCVYTGSDVTAVDLQAAPWPERKLWPLAFEQGEYGLSKIMRGGVKKAAGKDASWVGALVPRGYENHEADVGPSRGLSGDLAVLLGLMALAELPGETDNAFLHHWKNFQWTGARQKALPTDQPIRGVIVHIALERNADGIVGKSYNLVRDLEQHGAIVLG